MPFKSSIGRFETFHFPGKEMVLRKRDSILAKLLMLIRLHSHFPLWTAQHMKEQMLQQSGFVAEGLDPKNDSVMYSLLYLLKESQELKLS